MSAQHTKGPWKVFYAANGTMLGVGQVTGLGIADADGGLWGPGGEKEANARLIAAAPELLEALRPFAAVMADIGETEADEDTFRNANRAYAKAPAITVGDIRKAAALFSLATGESK